AARRARLRDPRRREAARARSAPAPRHRRPGARARGRHGRRGAQDDPRQDGSADGVILLTRRALWVGAAVAALGVLGFWVPWGLDAMLLADVVLLGAVGIDGAPALRPRPGGLGVAREAPPAVPVGGRGQGGHRRRTP